VSFAPKSPVKRLGALLPAILLLVLALLFHVRGPLKHALLGDASIPHSLSAFSQGAFFHNLFSRSTAAQSPPQDPPPVPSIHSITVEFNYDFSHTPACSPAIMKKCVEHFNIYDISSGKTKLFDLPAPPKAKGLVQGLTGQSPRLTFESGRHLLGVSAVQPDGTESDPLLCTLWVVIPPPANSK